ncbi:hypothetical protein EEL31_10520 [Brevibacillus laterosporus]|nr:hypothetical protein [Brevibacillus laterosporus]TPG68919.1 hypothetical protein EEL31_10520 [Brevibacillus laterosporus]
MTQPIIKVVDSIMGSGKSSAAINMINSDTENNYIYITPYLPEVERIKKFCSDRKFYDPKVFSKDGETFYKLDSFHNLLKDNKNIATTHVLFQMATEETKELIYSGNYILVLDEVIEVVKELHIKPHDINMLFENQWMYENDGLVYWNTDKEQSEGVYDGEFKLIRRYALNHNLVLHSGKMLLWTFPVEIFKQFKEVYVLTYLFEAQYQKYFYDINQIQYKKYIATKEGDLYLFKESIGQCETEIKKSLKEKIHIYQGDELNKIGDKDHSLSKKWYHEKKHMHGKMKNNVLNFFTNKLKSKSDFNMWTTFADYESKLKGKGYAKGFVSCTSRATNEYKDKTALAYTINRFLHPVIANYFISKGVKVNGDLNALQELIQWIWRSAIREDKEINLYIPSKRMRGLLIKWLDDDIK